jgi:hypothetical protein
MPTGLDEYGDEPADFDRVGELTEHRYIIGPLTVTKAEEIDSEYPQYGRFMRVSRVGGSEVWIETPRSLAREIGEAGLGSGDHLNVVDASKDDRGRWQFEIDS